MEEDIVVVGGGGHAKVIISLLLRGNLYSVVGYVDSVDKGAILGATYLGDDSQLPHLVTKHPQVALGIGGVTEPSDRERLYVLCIETGFRLPALRAPSSIVAEDVEIGDATVLMEGVVLQPGVRVGRGSIVNTAASIDHDCVVGDFAHVAPGAVLSGGVAIGSYSHVGTGAAVIEGVKIGERCIIGAGAVVIADCDDHGTYLGVPAVRSPGRLG